jgi:hypothetical protein
MGKIVAGAVSILITGALLLYGLAAGSQPGDVYLGPISLPLWVFLFVIAGWFLSGVGLILGGVHGLLRDSEFRAAITKQLRAGTPPRQVLENLVRAIPWPEEYVGDVAECILRGVPYREGVERIRRKRGLTQDEVVLLYKVVADAVAERCSRVRRRGAEMGVASTDELPPYAFPAVLATGPCGVFSAVKKGDIIYACNGRLIESVAELKAAAGQTKPGGPSWSASFAG